MAKKKDERNREDAESRASSSAVGGGGRSLGERIKDWTAENRNDP